MCTGDPRDFSFPSLLVCLCPPFNNKVPCFVSLAYVSAVMATGQVLVSHRDLEEVIGHAATAAMVLHGGNLTQCLTLSPCIMNIWDRLLFFAN